MLISCNTLKKHIKNSDEINFEKIWDTFTIRTAEVEEVIIKGNNFDNVVVAEITKCEAHPKSQRLSLLEVTDGKETYKVVCGAPNVKVGLKGALIKVGGYIDDMTIEAREVLGVKSYGMMCSGKELGISDNHDGIIELPKDTKLGVNIKEILPIEDIVVEIDNKSLTNRPDLWGHYGIAREIAAITGHELIPLELEENNKNKKDLNIKINNPELCYRYIGTKLDNIKNKETPMWMQIFLYYTGMRSINLIVDLTNYIMLELGQPMHAFDSSAVKNIEVGLANDKDTFLTLDNVKRSLTKEDLMIKNGGEYFAVAGVMGGMESEITENTNSLILESASFESSTVRKTATRLGLRTEASSRYEKSLDPNLAMIATKRFIKLLKDENKEMEFGSNITDIYPNEFKEIKINLNKNLLYKYIGFKIDDKKVIDILTSLEFKVLNKENLFEVIVPTFRATKDITIEQDLIEEVSRMYGYENFKEEPLKMDLIFDSRETSYEDEYQIKEYLVNKYNLNEVHTYLWNETDFLNQINIEVNNVKLKGKTKDNILRDDHALSLLEVANTNTKNYETLNIFEIATVIKNNENKKKLTILLSDNTENLETTYNKAKNIAYNLILSLKNKEVTFDYGIDKEYYNDKLTLNLNCDNKTLGKIKVFNKNLSNKINRKKSFVIIDINIEEYLNISKINKVYKEVNKYPITNLDYTIDVDEKSTYLEFDKIISKFKNNLILNRELLDVYLGLNNKKITIRYIVGSTEKTLNGKELQIFNDEFIEFLKENNMSVAG